MQLLLQIGEYPNPFIIDALSKNNLLLSITDGMGGVNRTVTGANTIYKAEELKREF